jgi:hypothetical protein
MDTTIDSKDTAQSAATMEDHDAATENMDPQQQVNSAKKRKRGKPASLQKLCHDSITVWIPVDVTADLKIAIQRTRQKRIDGIYEKFPALKKNKKKSQKDGGTSDEDDEAEDETSSSKDKQKSGTTAAAVGKKRGKKTVISAHAPKPSQYGSVLDYLEAKYVRGVQFGDDDDDNNAVGDGESEGGESIYSRDSFMDDDDLQRDVAEQVMASKTLTKLELEEDDADFFVNVGNLEVEDNEYGDNYDPLQDKEETTTTKKRKKSADGAGKKKENEDTLNKSAKSNASIVKSKASKASVAGKKKKTGAKAAGEKDNNEWQAMQKKIIGLIHKMSDDDLPKKKTKRKVALTCPQNKKPGDDITFA